MPPIVALIVSVEVLYGLACAIAAWNPKAPLWLRWPTLVWERVVHGPAPRRRPNYARIAYLERELGLAGPVEPHVVQQGGVTADETLAGAARLGEVIRAAAETER